MPPHIWKDEIGKLSHHAYCLEGDRRAVQKSLFSYLEHEWGIKTQGNLDFTTHDVELFTVDEARTLKERSTRTAITGKKIFVVSCSGMTAEAQNAMLKLLEDPTPDNYFFVLIQSVETLLPTLRSRLLTLKVDSPVSADESYLFAEKFLSSPLSRRIELVKDFCDDIKDEKKNKSDAEMFVRALERVVAEEAREKHKRLAELETLKQSEADICLTGASVKMILEHIALALDIRGGS